MLCHVKPPRRGPASAESTERHHPLGEAFSLRRRLERAADPGPPPEDEHAAPGRDERREFGERQGDRADGHRPRGRPGVAVVPHPQDAHGAPRSTGRLAEERPSPGSRLEEGDFEVVPDEGEDKARGPVPRPYVDEGPGGRQRGGRQYVADE